MKKIVGILIGLLVFAVILINLRGAKTITIGEVHKFSKNSEVKIDVIMKFSSQTTSQKKILSQEGVKEIFEYLILLKSDKTKVYDFKETLKTKRAYYRLIGTIDNKHISILIGGDYILIWDSSLQMNLHIVNKNNMSTLIEMISSYYESVKT